MDSWTPEQVVSLQQMGNSRARAVYEANLPDNFRRPQNDSSLESFIRAKYEHKKYIAREWVPPQLPKVNWEKEIDEEIEKQKRRKKTVVEKKPLSNVEVPQLPKPKNPSPKPGRVAQVVATTSSNSPSNADNKNADLLGLQNGEDFSGFISAPTKEEKKKEEDPIKSEEESFFNQTIPTEKEKVKLSKDSILALYGNTPSVNYNQFQPQNAFNPQMPVVGPQNGLGQFTQPPQYQQQFQRFPGSYQWMSMPQNMQMVPGSVPSTNQQQFQYQNGPSSMPTTQPTNLQMPMNYGTNPTQFASGTFPASQTIPNPFYGSQPNSLQQQFGNLTLNQNNPPNPAPTLSPNIWN